MNKDAENELETEKNIEKMKTGEGKITNRTEGTKMRGDEGDLETRLEMQDEGERDKKTGARSNLPRFSQDGF